MVSKKRIRGERGAGEMHEREEWMTGFGRKRRRRRRKMERWIRGDGGK